jgi:hypothetical protein
MLGVLKRFIDDISHLIVVEQFYFFFVKINFASSLLLKVILEIYPNLFNIFKYWGTINIPSVAFPIIQNLSLLYSVILCPAYATVRFVVDQTVRQDLAVKLFK